MLRQWLIPGLALLFCLTGCGAEKPEPSKPGLSTPEVSTPEVSTPEVSNPELSNPGLPKPAPPQLVATIKPLALIASDLLDGLVTITVLVPSGASPHDYALRPSDRQTLAMATWVVWLGEDMERFLVKPLQTVPSERVITLSHLAETAPNHRFSESASHEANSHPDNSLTDNSLTDNSLTDNSGHEHQHPDLHLWLDPHQAIAIARTLTQQICSGEPSLCPALQTRLVEVEAKYQALYKALAEQLAPQQTQPFIAWHRGFDSLVSAFGLRQLAWVSQSPELPPGAKQLLVIEAELKAAPEVRCLWQEKTHSNPVVANFAKRWGLTLLELDILGSHPEVRSYSALMEKVVSEIVDC